MSKIEKELRTRLSDEHYKRIKAIDNPDLHKLVAKFSELCNPDSVFVSADSPEDIKHIREEAIRTGEETELAMKGHSVHFDGFYDQARDKNQTKLLLTEDVYLGPGISWIDRGEGLKEIPVIFKDIMKGHKLYVLFFTLGPVNSDFSIPCVQLTDSCFVAHNEYLLYRPGYDEFKRLGRKARFFRFLHSQGEVENNVSKNTDKRRIYIDLQDETVYSANTQYGGNTIGLKKLALRLAINRASKEDWLAEHMFIMGVHGPKRRVTYFAGAFPSLCGKTSTSMLEGETIIGDDIAYLREKNGEIRAVNVEKGIFGIIEGINPEDDPILWEVLHSPGEIIFSNILVTEDRGVYWIGKDDNIPKRGINYSGEWTLGKSDAEGNEIPPAHRNARFTLDMKLLKNADPRLNDPKGVKIGGIIYGGRDSDTWVPVEEAFDWIHGVITKGASLESETTAATLERTGIREFNPMSNLDFLSITWERYIEKHLEFGAMLEKPPPIFSVNYFLKDSEGNFMNDKRDKSVWLKWMELRSHKEIKAIETPTGFMPKYEDLKRLFKEVLGKNYSKEDYIRQFTLRVPESLAKIDRLMQIYTTEIFYTPTAVFRALKEQRNRLSEAREEYGDYISPFKFY
ncbi:MAG: phosphoenolpyruvate carboxykinase (GTP) [Candidatus Hodarchaeota archaeon]